MQKKKTKAEILDQIYVSKSDIKHLLTVSWYTACRIFEMAEKIDEEQLGEFRLFDNKVRIYSVCRVTGINIAKMQKQFAGSSGKEKKYEEGNHITAEA